MMFKTLGRAGSEPNVTSLEVLPGDSVEGQRNKGWSHHDSECQPVGRARVREQRIGDRW